jgi:FkbM family methyltransferase
MVVRSIAERLSHRLIVRRTLPAPFAGARIYASSEGGLRYLGPRMDRVDPTLLRLVSETVQPGDTVWDIGANLGLFSLAAAVAAGPGGRVLSVEPDSTLVRLLRRSAAAARECAPLDVFPAAVSAECGVARFCIARRNRSTSFLAGFGTGEAGGVRATELVPTVSLDWLLTQFPAPHVLKIDVEGAEALVLRGGRGVLQAHHPRVICEVGLDNAAAVHDLLAQAGYAVYNGDQPAAQRTPLSAAPYNTVALPDVTAESAITAPSPGVR